MQSYTFVNEDAIGPFIFSCEHASNRLPPDISVSQEDQHFLQTHWGWDIGAESVTRALIQATDSQGILANYSRLWIDLNRSLKRTDLIRLETEGHILSFNHNLSEHAEQQRLQQVYTPFHTAYNELVEMRCKDPKPLTLISIHSFTPVWNGRVRTMDIGVLFDECEELGTKLAALLKKEDLFVEINAPYTGRGGLMFSVEDKGKRHRCPHLELEINQALICTPERQRYIAAKIHRALMNLIDENMVSASLY